MIAEVVVACRAWVAPRFLSVWGVGPPLGCDFPPEEGRFGEPNGLRGNPPLQGAGCAQVLAQGLRVAVA